LEKLRTVGLVCRIHTSSLPVCVYCSSFGVNAYVVSVNMYVLSYYGEQYYVILVGQCLCAGVAIEISLAKDRSLSVVITGKEEAVKVARKLVLQQLQTQVLMLPHHLLERTVVKILCTVEL